ncbi:MAG TPA: thioredoxin domain-containing protein [Gemmatimonadales bacterium]|nr:thioredoxin domain-containing protein [Gemmatimonadales bacterium]
MNRLHSAASPYLRSAAHQPIHWYAWGDEAFAAARAADKPVLLDIGAVWCHWCHVMDGESYEHPAIADFLNAHFVCIKVDRDERPDVDARYQRAVQALTRQGGWPLTAFLTPEGQVFYGGTYFPPDGKYGRPGFQSVLAGVLDAWRKRREQLEGQALAIRRAVERDGGETMAGQLSRELLDTGVDTMLQVFDPVNGGFGSQPKFPHPGAVQVLLTQWWADQRPEIRQVIDRTLEGMARGGIHDHVGGGFHRYSVDAEWIVPHFEKMAYDNSELLRAYCDAYAALGTPEYAEAARGIVRWVREVLADSAGGYAASQDADVGLDDDGDYFTWTRDEAAAVLAPDELDVAAEYYDIGTAGEMHHNPAKNVLHAAMPLALVARRLGRDESETNRLLRSAEAKLRAARALRLAPYVDRTRYASWNAMLVSAMLRAGAVLSDPWAAEHALGSLRRLRAECPEPDAVPHTPGGVGGLLEDQVQVAVAALDAYEGTGEESWLRWAEAIGSRVWRDYRDPDGGLFDREGTEGAGLLRARVKPIEDAPTPSANGVAGIVLVRLAELTGEAVWRDRAAELLRAFAGRASELGLHGATYLSAVDWLLNPPNHLVIVGPADDPVAAEMHQDALRAYAPRRVVQRVADGTGPLPPAILGMRERGGGAAGYACRGDSCSPPATDSRAWRETLLSMRPDVRLPAL